MDVQPPDDQFPTRSSTLRLSPDPDSPPIARSHVAEQLRGDGLPEGTVQDAVLGASELVTNAVLHAASRIELLLEWFPEVLRVSVCDESDALPVLRRPRGIEATGRGLLVVERLSRRWGAERGYGGTGKRVWFDLELPATAGGLS